MGIRNKLAKLNMKIKKFNESNKNEVDIDYVKLIFADILDDTYFESEIKEFNHEEKRIITKRITISIKMPELPRVVIGINRLSGMSNISIEELKQRVNKTNELVLDSKIAIERLLYEYSQITPFLFTNKFGDLYIQLVWKE